MNKDELDWDVSGVSNSEEVCYTTNLEGETKLRDTTSAIFLASALTGIPHLNSKTVGEYTRRTKVLIAAGIPNEIFDFTQQDIDNHLGTKVSAKQMDYKTFKNEVFASLEEVASNLATKFDNKDNEDGKQSNS
jgi:hypothetical protein|tara:strand:+ start:639 stop:1037 length:399 start_codon:yes stop_codon:yes gene_type:complete